MLRVGEHARSQAGMSRTVQTAGVIVVLDEVNAGRVVGRGGGGGSAGALSPKFGSQRVH